MSFGKTNETFKSAPTFHLNACVGTNGGPYNLSDYACGYFDAAKRVIESVDSNSLHLDVLVYPISHTFRHAVELSIKHVLKTFPRLWAESVSVQMSHNLRANWQSARKHLLRTGAFDADNSAICRLDRIVEDLMDIEPNGETFRYPASKKGVEHLRDWKLINLDVLLEQIEYAEDFFSWCDVLADGLYESRVHAWSDWNP